MHPIERRRRIATGRMSYLSLHDSELIVGQDFADNPKLNALLGNPEFNCLVLCPGVNATDLTKSTSEQKESLFVPGKKTLVIVIDGTWATAKKMMNRSPNLKRLQKICFTPASPSRFRVRKQPRAECYSTIEAIHQTIELIGGHAGFDLMTGEHSNLLKVFDKMVERQLEFMREAFENPNSTSYRKVKRRVA
jgi:DTW domain-containing protein YfiP